MPIIYESPDGGDTVYAREFDPLVPGNTAERRLIFESQANLDLHDQLKEDQLWGEIRRAAKTNTAIADILEQAKLLYHLSKQ